METDWNMCECCTRQKVSISGIKTIEFAFDREGGHLGTAFLNGLTNRAKQGLIARSKGKMASVPNSTKAEMMVILQSYAENGRLIIPRQLNELGTRDGQDLFEFKAGNLRLPFYKSDCGTTKLARITHGFVKRGKKTPRKELDLGFAIINEDRKR